MALPILPDTSNFLGVALVINRSRDGPRFVFHYPPHVQPVQGMGDKPASDADADAEDDDDIFLERPVRHCGRESGVPSSMAPPAERAGWKQDDHLFTDSGTQIVPWEHVAGFPTKDLESILTPARAYHKRLFQVSLDPLHCVSYPIYVPENGVWKKKKKHREEAAKSKKEDEDVTPADGDSAAPNGDSKALDADQVEVRDMAKPIGKSGEEGEDKKSSMTMFNLVFFLNPKKHEAKDLVDVLFSQIIKKINKVYKYCQQRSDFVWKESKRILALKDKAREEKTRMSLLWNEILSASSLAASMQDLYEAVSQNKIAALQLDTPEGTVAHSVQIHRPFHISDLPQDGDSNANGLWLTTANAFLDDEVLEEPGYRDKNFAILLMEDEKKIVTELQSDPDETSMAMVEFVRHCKATLSFHQVASQSSNILTLAQVRRFAEHFIFWRRAIAIPPLHGRDMYIVSPNCDLKKLPQATAQWARAFPLAPALPNFLAELSIAPRPYKAYCPGKAHRPLYMAMLGWLVRGGWVTQLCTFAYVVVWPEIVYEVEHEMEAEEIAKARKEQGQGGQPGSLDSDKTVPATATESLSPAFSALFSPSALGFDDSDLGSSTATLRDLSFSAYLNHNSRPVGQHESAESDQSSSPSSSFKADPLSPTSQRPSLHSEPSAAERAAEKARLERIADKAAREVAERATAHARKIPPTRTQHPSINVATHLAGVAPHIILDAKKATGKESRYLLAIGQRLMEGATRRDHQVDNSGIDRASGRLGVPNGGLEAKVGKDKDKDKDKDGKDWARKVAETWPLFWKYFNGRSALERIALQEEMKRKEVWNLLTAMSEYLICLRHW
ncbi:hypothetical protein GQ53DRAFT_830227 [Thozetella sp. PMI_491]|nr:hypothetical protein GQ53DRAFT_830227 [Thozetella sp. PMI_491]